MRLKKGFARKANGGMGLQVEARRYTRVNHMMYQSATTGRIYVT